MLGSIGKGRSFRNRLPPPLKAPLRPAKWAYRKATSAGRVLPSVIIIGAAKSGTTSLFSYLVANPAIARSETKEVHFFDVGYHRGLAWYRANFPTRSSLEGVRELLGIEPLGCEATPYYLAHPLAPYRIRGLLPYAKLIVVLRDPVERAVSHYHHNIRYGFEELPLDEAIEREAERLDGEVERILSVPLYNSYSHQHHSYLTRGHYAEQLERWLSLFPRDQLLAVDSKRLSDDPAATVRGVCEFLGVPDHALPSYRRFAARRYPRVDPALRDRLAAHFAPHNARLWDLLGEEMSWSRPPADAEALRDAPGEPAYAPLV